MSSEFNLASSYTVDSLKQKDFVIYPFTLTSAVYDLNGTSLEDILADLKKSVADGKQLIAKAISDKGIITAIDDTFANMASNILNIGGEGIIPVGDALPENVHKGKTFTNADEAGLTGTAYYIQEVNESVFSKDITASSSINYEEIGDYYNDHPYLTVLISTSTNSNTTSKVYSTVTTVGLGTGTDDGSPASYTGYNYSEVLLHSPNSSLAFLIIGIYRNANGHLWIGYTSTSSWFNARSTVSVKIINTTDCPCII